MEDGIEEFMVRFPPDLPLQAVIEIADQLMADGGIVPGFVPAGRGVVDVMVIEYSKLMGETTIIIPDRNLVSRIADCDARPARGVYSLKTHRYGLAKSRLSLTGFPMYRRSVSVGSTPTDPSRWSSDAPPN